MAKEEDFDNLDDLEASSESCGEDVRMFLQWAFYDQKGEKKISFLIYVVTSHHIGHCIQMFLNFFYLRL